MKTNRKTNRFAAVALIGFIALSLVLAGLLSGRRWCEAAVIAGVGFPLKGASRSPRYTVALLTSPRAGVRNDKIGGVEQSGL